jgi:hypothetical protein
MLPVLAAMQAAGVPIAAQPAAFHTTDATPCFTRLPQFPDGLESIQIERAAFRYFARAAKAEGFGYIGGCCGCNAAYIRVMADELARDREDG